jgi:anti-anti-sigma regulatory factor
MIRVEFDETGLIKVIGDATVHKAEALRDGLIDSLPVATESRALDLSNLTALDTCGVQILLSFKRSIKNLRVQGCPEPQRLFLERIGVAQDLL